jgi:hypothetical protein
MMLRWMYGKVRITVRDFLRKWISFRSRVHLKKLKGKYAGERCFIIGNGPSLKVEDLEKLKKEYTFGSHRIYKIFHQTTWRPTFYCAQDTRLIIDCRKEIQKLKLKEKFVCIPEYIKENFVKNATILKIDVSNFYPDLPNFSEDVSECIYEGFTVTYACLQLAFYMGFKEVYLLGVDHSYAVELNDKGEIIHKDVKNHFSEDYNLFNIPQTFKSTLGYKKAKEVYESHNRNIYNVSRGGALEIFSRKSFDDLHFD